MDYAHHMRVENIRRGARQRDNGWQMASDKHRKATSKRMKNMWSLRRQGLLPMPQYNREV
jgi:hypothetical protein